jgi:uncharacterized protein (DUF1015 family)
MPPKATWFEPKPLDGLFFLQNYWIVHKR